MSQKADTETELKLELDVATAEAILLCLPPVSGVEVLWQKNIFFDSPEQKLKEKKWALRLRSENDRWFLTLKGPKLAESTQGIHSRPEIEEEISEIEAKSIIQGFSLDQIKAKPCVEALKIVGALKLKPFLEFQNCRKCLSWQGKILELDELKYEQYTHHELELEAPLAEMDSICKELQSWFNTKGWSYKPSALTKLRRVSDWQKAKKHLPS